MSTLQHYRPLTVSNGERDIEIDIYTLGLKATARMGKGNSKLAQLSEELQGDQRIFGLENVRSGSKGTAEERQKSGRRDQGR